MRKNSCSLSFPVFKLEHWLVFCLWTGLEFIPLVFLVLRLPDSTELTLLDFLGLQLADCRSWDFTSIMAWTNSLWKISISPLPPTLSIDNLLLVLFLWRIQTKPIRQYFSDSSVGKESACNVGDPGSIPGLGRSTGEGIGYPLQYSWASLVTQLIKNPPAMWETWVQSLGWGDPLEKGKATHCSILNWRIP